MIQKNKILIAVLMAGILSVVSLSGSGVTRAESVQTGQTEKKSHWCFLCFRRGQLSGNPGNSS